MNDAFIHRTLKGLWIATAFVAGGLLALSENEPTVGWLTIGVFGGMSVVALAAIWFSILTGQPGAVPRPDRPGREQVVLRDGRDYAVELDGDSVILKHREGEERRVCWVAVTEVFLIAIDGWPVGSMSYLVHQPGQLPVEIPLDCQNNEALLAEMQQRLPEFDNDAFIQAMGMLHGLVKLWPRA